ncbi:MAG: SMP-30/gluconolactonase/LRE family protein [Bacteroidota bacterium]
MKKVLLFSGALLLLVFIFWSIKTYISIQPLAWNPQESPELKGALAMNSLLESSKKIDLKGWQGPEDIAIDKDGNLFSGVHGKDDFDTGIIVKIDTNGKHTVFCDTKSWVSGLEFDNNGNLIGCDSKRGLISIDKNGQLKVLASKDEKGRDLLIPNDVDIASDGQIYFSNTSSEMRFSLENVMKIILESRQDGGLYRYDPKTEKVKTLIDGALFANGVAVSKNDDFVLMVELTTYRVLRYWLKGSKKGKIDVFIDNLPGFPNGISRRPDGSFWVGFSTSRDENLDKIHPNPLMKKIVFGLPQWMQPQNVPYGMIMHLSESGDILKMYYDTTGEWVAEASSVEESNGFIYIGGDLTNDIVKYQLPSSE